MNTDSTTTSHTTNNRKRQRTDSEVEIEEIPNYQHAETETEVEGNTTENRRSGVYTFLYTQCRKIGYSDNLDKRKRDHARYCRPGTWTEVQCEQAREAEKMILEKLENYRVRNELGKLSELIDYTKCSDETVFNVIKESVNIFNNADSTNMSTATTSNPDNKASTSDAVDATTSIPRSISNGSNSGVPGSSRIAKTTTTADTTIDTATTSMRPMQPNPTIVRTPSCIRTPVKTHAEIIDSRFAVLTQLIDMGFSNDGGRLMKLIRMFDGNIGDIVSFLSSMDLE